MIETKNDQMTDQQIAEHLLDVHPEYAGMDCNISLLRGAGVNDIEARIGRTDLLVNATYKQALEAHINITGERDSIATRKMVFERKKVADEAKELTELRNHLRHFRIVTNLGERINVEALSLPQLRKHAATIAENRRQQRLTADQIRTEEKAKAPKDPRRNPPYDDLPANITAVELNKLLRGPDARKLLRRHGAENLNDRLYGRG
jgi:hypothetical protein